MVRHFIGPTPQWSDKYNGSETSLVRHLSGPTNLIVPKLHWSDTSMVRQSENLQVFLTLRPDTSTPNSMPLKSEEI